MQTITSRSNSRIKQLRAALADQRKLAGGLIAIEGEHLLQEAVRSGLKLETIFVREDRLDLLQTLNLTLAEMLVVTLEVFQSATEAPQGIAALLAPPEHTIESLLAGTPLIIVAAGLQDPGNLGTLIRTAEAFGATGVLTLPGTVSPWNQKALRSSAGSTLRLPIVADELSALDRLRSRGVRILAAVPADGIPAHQSGLQEPCAILLGNEGAGLTAEQLAYADERLTIPTPGPTESLNAAIAGSILLYEASRQRGSVS